MDITIFKGKIMGKLTDFRLGHFQELFWNNQRVWMGYTSHMRTMVLVCLSRKLVEFCSGTCSESYYIPAPWSICAMFYIVFEIKDLHMLGFKRDPALDILDVQLVYYSCAIVLL